MAKNRIVPAHEAPRIARGSLQDTVVRLRGWLLTGANQRSYAPARRMSALAIERKQDLKWFRSQCGLLRPIENQNLNFEVLWPLWDLGGARSWRCYEPVFLPWNYRADLGLVVASDLQIVEKDEPFAFWMQLRKGYTAPSMEQLGLLARVFLLAAEDAGYPELRLRIADMRHEVDGRRGLTILELDDLPVASPADAIATIQLLAEAYDQLAREGFDPAAEKKRRKEERDAAARRAGRAPGGLFPD